MYIHISFRIKAFIAESASESLILIVYGYVNVKLAAETKLFVTL